MKTAILSRLLSGLIVVMLILTSCGQKPSSTGSDSSAQENSLIGSNLSCSQNEGEITMNSETSQTSTDSSSVKPGSSGSASSRTSSSTASSRSAATRTEKINISEYDDFGGDNTKISYAIKEVAAKSAVAKIKGENIKYVLELKKHNYVINNPIVIDGANNMTIEGNGASLIFSSFVTAFDLRNCTDLSLQNLSIDYYPMAFTQGVITKIAGNKVTVKIDDGYRSDLDFFNIQVGDGLLWSNVHNTTNGGVMEGTPHSYAYLRGATSAGNNTVTVTHTFGDISKLKVGYRLSFFHRGAGTIVTNNCNSNRYVNLNVYSSAGFAIHEGDGEGNSLFKNVKIVPGPKPAGATVNRVRSSNGDATHFSNVKKGPTFDGCTITHCGDDCVNIHGFFFHVLKITGNTMVVAPKWDTPLTAGETIEGYSDQYASLGTAKIKEFTVDRNATAYTNAIKEAFRYNDPSRISDTLVYIITLDKAITGLKAGGHITSLDRLGSGAVIKNSTFGYNRARGVVVKGQNIVIKNNTFIGSTHPAIVAHADILWCESGFPVNVKIRNNKITNMAISSNMIEDNNIDQIGSILVNVSPPTNVTGFYPCFENKNILIENNTITNTQVYGIFAINCNGITIRNNTITNPFMNGIGKVGNLYNIHPTSGIFVGMSKNISITGNTVTKGAKSGITKAAEIHSNCSGTKTESGNTFK